MDRCYAAQTVIAHLNIIHMIFSFAVVNDIIPVNPAEQVSIPRGLKRNSRRALTKEEIEIIKANVNKPFGLFYFFILYTGCRRGEALAIQFKDIDRENKVIHITKSVYFKSGKPEIKVPKTEAGKRVIPLLDVLAEKLPKGKQDNFLFGESEPLTGAQVKRMLNTYQKRTGLKITPYYLRHGYATILYDAGIDIKTAQGLLGHSDIQTTMNVYTHLSVERTRIESQKLNEFTKDSQDSKN